MAEPPKPRNPNLDYDDQLPGENEAPAQEPAPPHRRKRPWPETPDEVDARWERGIKGWLTIRDPFTGERHQVPTKYCPEAPRILQDGKQPVPQWMVRRAMEKLPPRAPGGTQK